MKIAISEVRFVPASDDDRRKGLRGFVCCVLNDSLLLDGITLRRTRTGRAALSFPSRRDRLGYEHVIIKPLGDAARVEFERQVLRALGPEVLS